MTIKAGEDAILLASDDQTLNKTDIYKAAVATAKVVIPHTKPTCNVTPQPAHIPDAQYRDLLDMAKQMTAAKTGLNL